MTSRNDAAVLEMGDETLKKITQQLVTAVRSSATVDWNLKDSVRAAMRSKIRRLLAKYDYPPDRDKAIESVLQQAEMYANNADRFEAVGSRALKTP
jgi:type I restriction enzyme R subunit